MLDVTERAAAGRAARSVARRSAHSEWAAAANRHDPVAVIAAYLGGGDSFDRAVCHFAESYADQSERDHAALVAAIDTGRLESVPDV
jgi:hypothetical protein